MREAMLKKTNPRFGVQRQINPFNWRSSGRWDAQFLWCYVVSILENRIFTVMTYI